MVSILYNLIIRPLVLIVELIYSLMFRMIGNEGVAIIAVSVVISFLVLPLYRRADALQDEERDKQASMAKWVKHIRKYFRGDEQYMILNAYYREEHYSPLYALRSSVSLFLQIPFFIAAYSYLSNLKALTGVSFLFIRDLSQPDALFTIGGFTVNILPITMTVVNCISGYIYTRGNYPVRTKVQIYVLAAIFLVILYTSPSGLVLYWTCNNLFSLGKNIFFKVLKDPDRVFRYLAGTVGVALVVFLAASGRLITRKRIVFAAALLIVCLVPAFRFLLKRWRERRPDRRKAGSLLSPGEGIPKATFLVGALLLAVLIGAVIPSAVIHTSPSEFINVNYYVNPIKRYIIIPSAISFGFFVLWLGIFYALASERGRKAFTCGVFLFSGTGLVNYLFFGRHMGNLTANLVYDEGVRFSGKELAVNLAVFAAMVFGLLLIWHFKTSLVRPLLGVVLVVSVFMAGRNVLGIENFCRNLTDITSLEDADNVEKPDGMLHLSRNGKNVIVFMLDKAINDYVPYMMNEKPELLKQFDGFTYYPNTLSFGKATNFGSPAIFGGYEYTPTEMNARSDELLKDKHDEALKVLPALFGDSDFNVAVMDPPWAGYSWIPDLTIYDGMKNVTAFHALGKYAASTDREFRQATVAMRQRNFVFYGFMKCLPAVLQRGVYDGGHYYGTSTENEVTSEFLEAYTTMTHLKDMTSYDDEGDNLLVMQNDMTHEPTELQLPDYVLTTSVNNTGLMDMSNFTLDGKTLDMSTKDDELHYEVNMSAFLNLGAWFDEMRAEGVYDNTRIILVADHGRWLGQVKDLLVDENVDGEAYHPLLMVKDFNATGFTTSEDFMTNADVPTLATNGLIDHPVNPFTGKAITSDEKTAHDQLITTSRNWDANTNNGHTFDTSDGYWYSVHDNIFDRNNWTYIGPGESGS